MKDLGKVADALQLMSDMYYKTTVNHVRVFRILQRTTTRSLKPVTCLMLWA